MFSVFLQAAASGAPAIGDVASGAESALQLINNPMALGAGIVFIIATVLIILFLKKIIINSVLGLIAWAILHFAFHVSLPFIPSLVVSVIFGPAGIGVMLVLLFFGINLG